jgi:hypothetical protein
VEAEPPQLLALSATTHASVGALRRTVAAIRKVAGGRVPVAAGGQLFVARPALRDELEISLHARDARELAAAVVSFLARTLH